jgi:carboxyl-terminal processing protease
MKRNTLLLLLCLPIAVWCQSNTKMVLDSVLLVCKSTSMYTESINWDSLSKAVYLQAEGAESIADLQPAFQTLLNGLGDKHACIRNAGTYNVITCFNDFKQLSFNDTRERSMDAWYMMNNPDFKFSYQIIDNQIGYLKVVGIGPGADMLQEAQSIRKAIETISNAGITNWIIDLRYNAGGNMNPMMSGLSPLFGNGKVGSTVSSSGTPIFEWTFTDGNFIYAGVQAIDLPYQQTFETPQQIAVLTSRWTVSSGELVAVAFKGQAHTRFFGEVTGGYSTNNNFVPIQNEVVVTISTGFYCDRNGIIYNYNVPVDEEIPFIIETEITKDTGIAATTAWLLSK